MSLAALALAPGAWAAGSWTSLGLAGPTGHAAAIIEATDALLASEIGKQFPGRLLLLAQTADGADPTPHSFVPIYRSAADREAYADKLQAAPVGTEFQEKLGQLAQGTTTASYRVMRSWGDISDADKVWVAYAFSVTNAGAFAAASESFMASATGQKFPGQLHLSSVVEAGVGAPTTHVLSVGFASEAEMEAWGNSVATSPEWQSYLAALGANSQFPGANLSRTVKSGGAATLKKRVSPWTTSAPRAGAPGPVGGPGASVRATLVGHGPEATLQALLASALAFPLGALGWTLAEYGLHRFVFHGASAKGLGAGEHRRHHAEVDYFAPWWQKALAALAVTAVMMPLAVSAAGAAPGASFTAGFIAAYLGYEVLHRRAHTRPPHGPYGRWRRRNHFAHHFVDPRRAHGVTTPLWDMVFGTRLPVGRVRVPRRLALPWLLDANGQVHAAYKADYELVGDARRDAHARRADAEAARADRSPEIGG